MISLGIDESYTNFGICVTEGDNIIDGKIVKVKSFNFKGLKSKTEKREFVRDLTKRSIEKYKPNIIIVERIRTFSKGFMGINTYIKNTAPLVASIVDSAYPQKVYSVDTRCWKSRVIGQSKGNKSVSVKYIKNRFGLKLNDDAADAACISLFGLEYEKWLKNKLIKEET